MTEPTIDEVTDELDETKVLLTVEEDDWFAVCHPDISNGYERRAAPFQFEVYGDAPDRETVSERISDDFNRRVDAVYEIVEDSDDPLDAITDLEPDDLLVGDE